MTFPPLVSVWSSFAHRYVITSPLLSRSGASAWSIPLGSNMRGRELQGKTAQTGGRRNLERIPTLKLKDGSHLRKLMQTPPPTLPACQRKIKQKQTKKRFLDYLLYKNNPIIKPIMGAYSGIFVTLLSNKYRNQIIPSPTNILIANEMTQADETQMFRQHISQINKNTRPHAFNLPHFIHRKLLGPNGCL